jgi:hypothetical protein
MELLRTTGDDSAGREQGCGHKGRRLMCAFLCTTAFFQM